ncbi:MAG: NAD(P)/FAD-dependent oxidoreductase [Candidatus Tectomicrobia bacterium]|uniref:NAD(P)/FAD-dependent oxidoreductase n=1 Tax=Tectimicrobiota bacterium TaxID=2528274 RepID=A0A933GP41_UNCTE|nr:NAD(P)/FAD-dependent oxidoreductase [Candidatus Tectomicrobia bacterium]
MERDEFVIVGGGPAGISALEAIRKVQAEASITLIGNETAPLYARMATPYYLSHVFDESGILLREPDFLHKNKIKSLLGTKLISLDVKTKTLTLSSGVQMNYGKLLLATGSSPNVPRISGLNQPGVFYNWTREDAGKMFSRIQNISQAVVIGSGFIGLQLVQALLNKGIKVSVIEITPQILPTMLDKQGAEIVEKFLREKGVNIFTDSVAESVENCSEKYKAVKLKSGLMLSTEMIVVAAGVRPNLDFIDNSGLSLDKGILVDTQMRTNQPDIFAAGDIAQAYDLINEKPVLHALWPVAVEQGRVAGCNMAGRTAVYPGGMSYNILDILDLSAGRVGLLEINEDMEIISYLNSSKNLYRRYSFLKGRMVGCLMVGGIEGLGMAKGLIQSKKDLTPYLSKLKQDPLSLHKVFVSSNYMGTWL